MRALPFGVPKLMVSTLASGDVGPYVGVSDITMMHPVADIAGLNRITRTVLAQAAAAITAMAATRPATTTKPAVGLTMFGVTTPCVTRVADALRATHDPLVFHATGTGGRALEMLADSGMLEGLIDATTTEIADELVGGVLTAGPDRLGAVVRTGLPYVGAPGALDMVNFWAPDTIPDRFSRPPLPPPQRQRHPDAHHARGVPRHRRLHRREAQRRPRPGPLPHPRARRLRPRRPRRRLPRPARPAPPSSTPCESAIRATPDRQVIRLPLHINDPEFADALVAAYRAIAEG